MSRDIHAEVTAALIAAIEADPGDPVMPWHRGGGAGLPRNVASGEAYRGANVLSLWLAGEAKGCARSIWGTYRQWSALGCQVRRGETATPVVFYKAVAREREDGEEDSYRVLRWFPVFNVDQVEGFAPSDELGPALPRLADVDDFVRSTGAEITEGGDRACYVPATDRIHMPDGRRFFDTESGTRTENYYAVLMHELTHWTGHETRCARDLRNRFGSEAYAMEELVAELGAAFLCAGLGITPTVREDHARYLVNWLKVLKSDKTAIFTAAAKAQAAVGYLT